MTDETPNYRDMLKAYMSGVESGDHIVCLDAIGECPRPMRPALIEIAREVFAEKGWETEWMDSAIASLNETKS